MPYDRPCPPRRPPPSITPPQTRAREDGAGRMSELHRDHTQQRAMAAAPEAQDAAAAEPERSRIVTAQNAEASISPCARHAAGGTPAAGQYSPGAGARTDAPRAREMTEERRADDHELPTPRSTLAARYVDLQVKCRSCMRMRNVDLQALIDAGKGDVPLFHLRFRCSYCGHRGCDALVVPKERARRPPGSR